MREGGLRDVSDVLDAPVELGGGMEDVGVVGGGVEGEIGDFRNSVEGSAEDCRTGASAGDGDPDHQLRVGAGGVKVFRGGCRCGTGEFAGRAGGSAGDPHSLSGGSMGGSTPARAFVGVLAAASWEMLRILFRLLRVAPGSFLMISELIPMIPICVQGALSTF